MRSLIFIILLLLSLSWTGFADDSRQKDRILSARAREKEKRSDREMCRQLSLPNAVSDNRCFEQYPNDVMTWGKGFSGGLAKVTVAGKVGFINPQGKLVIPAKLNEAGRFSEGVAPFEARNGKWGYINETGKVVIKPVFDWAISFSEGLGLVQVGELWGFVDKTGKIVIEPQFDEASSFKEGSAAVGKYVRTDLSPAKEKTGGRFQWHFIDKSGKYKFDRAFDGISRNFNGGLALVDRVVGFNQGVVSQTYVIDTNGRELWELGTWYITWFSEDVLVIALKSAQDKSDVFAFIDRDGKRLSEKTFARLSELSEGLAAARGDRTAKYGYVNKFGEFLIKPQFDSAMAFSEGLAAVEVKGWGFIDKSGNWTIKPEFGWADEFHEGFALVAPKGDEADKEKTGYIDRNGKYIWKPTK